MGKFKKEASRKVRDGKTGDGMANVKVKGENFYRQVSPLCIHGITLIFSQICEEGKAAQNSYWRDCAT